MVLYYPVYYPQLLRNILDNLRKRGQITSIFLELIPAIKSVTSLRPCVHSPASFSVPLTRKLRSFCLWLFLTLLISPAALSQDASILLGVRYQIPVPKRLPYYVEGPDSLSQAAYTTILITKRGESVSLSSHARGLLVPRDGGVWRISTRRSAYNDWVEDFVLSAPLNERPQRPGIQTYNGEYCMGYRAQIVHYAGPDYIGLEQTSTGYCEDGAHPWLFNTYAFVPFDSTMHLGLPIRNVLGTAGREAMYEATDSFLKSLRSEIQRSMYLPEPDAANWTIKRDEGHWKVVMRLDGGGVAEGTYTDLDLDLRLPPRLVGNTDLYPDWNTIKAYASDAVDAFSSPRRDLLVILHPTYVTAHLLTDGRIGPPRVSYEFGPRATAVMARWGTTFEALQWARLMDSPEDSLSENAP